MRKGLVVALIGMHCMPMGVGAGTQHARHSSQLAAPQLVIADARVFTGRESRFIEHANIVIAGGRIVSVSTAPVKARGARVIDASGRAALPGLIDAHVHLFLDYDGTLHFPRSDAEARGYAAGKIREKLQAYLVSGFTTIVSPGDFWPEIIAVREAVWAGQYPSPRLFVAGGVFLAPGGHYVCRGEQRERRRWCDAHFTAEIGSEEAARAAVRRYADSGVDLIAYDSRANAVPFSRNVAAALIGASHGRGLRVLAHGSDVAQLPALGELGLDGFFHPPARSSGGELTHAGLASVRGKPLAITLAGGLGELVRRGTATARQRTDYEALCNDVRRLLEAGALPVFASDLPGTPPAEALAGVIQMLEDLGLDRTQILQSATRNAAHALLGRRDLGTLEAGSLADIVLVDGDPLVDLTALQRVVTVVHGGRVVHEGP